MLKRLHGALAAAADRGPKDFAELLLTPGWVHAPWHRSLWSPKAIYGTPHRDSRIRHDSQWHTVARMAIRFPCL